jgi:hypothetical protein
MRTLIFIHNTDSGIFNSISGYCKRVFSEDRPCSLCSTTCGPLGMRRQWRSFIRKLDLPADFLHRDEFVRKHPRAFIKAYPKSISYPCIVMRTDDAVEILVTPEEINACKTLDELIDLVAKTLIDGEERRKAAAPAKHSAHV